MPFLRHARDKRGYETTFVMHSYRAGGGPSAGRTRLLYMFRTPSNRKVGRNLLDPEVMEALEHTHPDLTFDWQGMLRVAGPMGEPERERGERDRGDRDRGRQRKERPERSERRERGDSSEARARQGRNAPTGPAEPRREPPVAEVPLAILEDDSLLGRTAGAVEAARMRASYNELVQRVARRARTPEERDRLIERTGRLNPDDWQDADAVTAATATFAADCESIRQELPRRRRGRRGGRARDREPVGSGTMENDADELEVVDAAGADDRGLDGGVGAGDAGGAAAAGDPLHDVD